ncbi:MAG: hypothetical protein COA79_18630 [Planctomycetota bacterium]|nr:MAG: hypothetical protein COA79_18630 [Planctomycetota bacterium]
MKFNSILSLCVCLSAVLFFSQSVAAEENEKPAKAKKEKKVVAPMEDLTHTGVVEEKKNKKRNTFYLKTAAGKIRLPVSPKKSKNPIVLASFVGKKVTVTGKGYIKVKTTKKGESKSIQYKKLLSVKETEGEKAK